MYVIYLYIYIYIMYVYECFVLPLWGGGGECVPQEQYG